MSARPVVLALVLLLATVSARAGTSVHTTYLWHLEQPIYWPAPNAAGTRYQAAWESLQARDGGAAHPQNDLREIFGKDDRVAVYQWRVKDAVAGMRGYGEAGVQVSYSGGLIENIASLAAAGQLGYSAAWDDGFREGRGWTTSGGETRLDIVQFPFHHGLLPLLDDEVVRWELRLYREVYAEAWGASPGPSRGLFPSEMAFAEHLIPALVAEDIEWVIVSNAHLSRACEGYPFQAGSGGDNIPPPNAADVQNPAQSNWNRLSIDRGVAPANAVPFAYVPHRARYVDPATGVASVIVVVPAAQSESWKDGYQCFGTDSVAALAPQNDSARPMLLLLAHDGDNAFGGGYSYYMECTPNFLSAASGAGYTPSTVQQYLRDHPVPASDIVHVESGAWVNADGDFGAPSFLNWNWPLVNRAGQVDPASGWAEDERNWAIITAATNVVRTASELRGAPSAAAVLHPESGGGEVARAWHFLLGALNSGYMYYGKALDMELKPTVACNAAIEHAEAALAGADLASERTAPTVWLPQRWPDNPGGLNFGPLYGYRQTELPSDFLVWTFVHDVSGVASVTLKVRRDADGRNPLADDANETYAGGAGVGAWDSIPMTGRAMPTGNVFDDPEIDASVLPTAIAQVFHAEVTGYEDVLLDYYVEARDVRGTLARSPIQHVYVGTGGGAVDPEGVHWTPARPTRADVVTVRSPKGGFLHWGVNGWQAPAEALWPAGSVAWTDGLAVESPLAGPDGDGFYAVALGPFGAETGVESIEFVIHGSDGSWDNNGGQDYHISITDAPPPPDVVTPPADVDGPGADVVGPAPDVVGPRPDAPGPRPDGSAPGPDLPPGADVPPGTDVLATPDASAGADVGAADGTGGGGGCAAGGSAGATGAWLLLLLLAGLGIAWRNRGSDPII